MTAIRKALWSTPVEHGRLPLTKLYLPIYLVMQSKTNIAALALMRQLGVSWKAAWLLKHKRMEVIAQREANHPLQRAISVEDAYLAASAPAADRDANRRTRSPFSPR